jgi:4-amino-4-deoxy-L-arabinose transferase-like glycosyltransferase
MRHRILLAASLFYLCAADIAWVAIDTRPPFWDMANHATWSLGVLHDFQQNGVAAFLTLPHDSGIYPPLYYAVTAVFYWLFGTTIGAAQLANLPAIILLGLSTFGIAKTVLDPSAAVLAAMIANFIPFMLWLSRETMIEYWLAALVAVSLWALLRSEEFSNPKWSLLFGAFCGLGMLTKWTFAIFVGLPAFWAARKNFRNAVKAGTFAAVIAAYWYVPQFATMPRVWQQVAIAAQNEQDPGRLSIQGWIFYIRALEGYLLLLPLFIAFLAGLIVVIRNWRLSFPKWTPLALCLLGGWIGLMLLPNEDPRYAVAGLPVVAIFCAAAFEKRKAAQIAIVGILVFQHVMVSFGIPQLPERIILMKGTGGAVSFDWNLYTQTYFGLWGRPERQDWSIERVLQRVSASAGTAQPVRVGLIPDLPRFDVPAFQFVAEVNRYPVVISRQLSADEKDMQENDYLLMSLGGQTAFGSQAPHAAEINANIVSHPERFQIIDTFTIPSGETIRLYQCVR